MRTIKFRAWDGLKMRILDEIVLWAVPMIGIVQHRNTPDLSISGKDVVFMQSTGLTDCKGKEIYEGDILKLHCSSSHPVTATIEWSEECPRLVARIHDKEMLVVGGSMDGKKVNMREVHCWAGSHTCLSKHSSQWKYLEIIGNIYENSELLK